MHVYLVNAYDQYYPTANNTIAVFMSKKQAEVYAKGYHIMSGHDYCEVYKMNIEDWNEENV